jgi:hypothetical protein
VRIALSHLSILSLPASPLNAIIPPIISNVMLIPFIGADVLVAEDVVRNPGRVSFVTDIGDPAVPQIGSITWVVRDSQRTQKELAGIGHIAERQCDRSFERRR